MNVIDWSNLSWSEIDRRLAETTPEELLNNDPHYEVWSQERTDEAVKHQDDTYALFDYHYEYFRGLGFDDVEATERAYKRCEEDTPF